MFNKNGISSSENFPSFTKSVIEKKICVITKPNLPSWRLIFHGVTLLHSRFNRQEFLIQLAKYALWLSALNPNNSNSIYFENLGS